MLTKLALKGEPQQHQRAAAEKSRLTSGLLLYHGLGSGKSRSALEIGERNPGTKLVVPPAALKENFLKEIKKHGADPNQYKLVSLETFRKDPEKYIKQYKPSVVIADEFHRARNIDSVSYEAFKDVRGQFPKMIGLTGSPLSNKPSELVPLINTVAGRQVLPNEEVFDRYFINERKVNPGFFARLSGAKPGVVAEPKNLALLQKVVSPYVHSFTGDEKYRKHIPAVETKTIYTPMDDTQQKYYDFTFNQLPRWARRKIESNLPPSKREARSMNTFLSAARQISDSPESFGATTDSPKIRKMMSDIEKGIARDPNFKSVTYSNFLDSGLKPLARRLQEKKISYGLFTGEQSDKERQQIINDYNSNKLKHLLISPAGGEGLDLVGTKMLQVTEPHWNPERTKQVIGRAARYRSHDALPENERKVDVREYLSEPHMKMKTKIKRFFGLVPKDVHEIGVDQYIRNRADEKEKLNRAFLDALSGVK